MPQLSVDGFHTKMPSKHVLCFDGHGLAKAWFRQASRGLRPRRGVLPRDTKFPSTTATWYQFDFPAGWEASKYDEWSFYRQAIMKICNDIKAVDILAVDSTGTAWLIEVKDYRTHPRTKAMDLCDEICRKVLDTLAAMLPARFNASNGPERAMAQSVLQSSRLRVVLHLEQPLSGSLSPAINPANILLKLKQKLRPIDADPRVVNIAGITRTRSLGWTVR